MSQKYYARGFVEEIARECQVIRVDTPDGTMHVTIIENPNGEAEEILIAIGKTGTKIRAWTETAQQLANGILANGGNIVDIINALTGIRSDMATRLTPHTSINSGAEGIVYCLQKYLYNKAKELNRKDEIRAKLNMPWKD